MKQNNTHTLIFIAAALAAVLGLGSCANPALHISTPAVQAQILGDVEKDLLAGGGALLISGGSSGAAVAAITAQELKNLPGLQQALAASPSGLRNTGSPGMGKQPVAGVTP